MSLVSPSAALPTLAPAPPADRIRNCIKLLNGLTATTGPAKSDMNFVRDELIDLMLVFHDLSTNAAIKALVAAQQAASPTETAGPEVTKAT
jgi:hypothetical protein